MPVIECDVDAAEKRLAGADVAVREGHTDHERWRAERENAVAVAYDGKVVVQGRNSHRLAALVRDEGGGRAYCYFDGASRGNPGPAAIGWTIVTDAGIVAEDGSPIGTATNNRAEYEALIEVLEVAREYGFEEVHLRGDAELIVKQVHGEWNTNDPDLRERRVTVHELLAVFDEWTLEHVPREANERADARANEALDRTNG